MLRVYACVTVLAVLSQTVFTQDAGDFPDEWEASDMPSPWRSPQQCGLEKPGYICDPDRILSVREMYLLDWLLAGFYVNDTKCPCSTYWCERIHRGSHMSIAVVRKLKLANTFEDPARAGMQAASNFALKLQESYWNFGDCDDDIVLVYARDDGVLYISYGQTIGYYMDIDKVDNVQRRHGYHFRKNGDLLTGFIEIVLAMREILDGSHAYDPNQAYYEKLLGGASVMQSSGVLATVALTSTILTRRWLLQ